MVAEASRSAAALLLLVSLHASASGAIVPRRRRLRMHLEGLPRVIHGADFIFCVFFFTCFFWLTPIQRRGLKICGRFAYVRARADVVRKI